MKKMKKIFAAVLVLLIFITFTLSIHADSLDEVNKELEASRKELASQEGDYQKILTNLNSIKLRLGTLEKEIQKKEQEVKQGEEVLVYQQTLLNERARSYYKNITKETFSLLSILVAEDLSTSLRDFFYQKSLVDEDKRTIIKVVLYIKNLEEIKANLESEKTRLAALKTEVDEQEKILAGKITQTRRKIAELSARQQQLIAQKLAGLNIPRSAGTSLRGCVDDREINPGFSPRFAFFTYGAPHRKGFNQYGAWGRAKTGQNEEQILQEYYSGLTLKKDYDQGAQINVDGYGTFSIEDYVKRIYEMPDSWTDNNLAALKAQAVAARTYALNKMQRIGSICTTEACQVFKPEPKGGNWEQAVIATAGWVLMDGGNPAFTEYASTHGGYIINLGKFDGRDGNPGNFGELNDRAYDKESPWFYCDWGSRSEYNKTAWLKPTEVSDIVNTILLAKSDSSVGEHLYQTDKPNPAGTDTWDAEKVKSELRARGGNPYNNISDVSMSVDFGAGRVTSVNVSGDIGNTGFDAREFKDWFNLRAPANIQIVGPLFNIEKR